MAQFLRPDSDVANTWTNGFAAIDESVASDADFAYSANNPNGSGAEFGLSNPTGTPGSGTVTVRYRYAKVNSGVLNSSGSAVDLTVRLLEGSTERGSTGHTGIPGSWTAGSFTVPASNITNWSDLRVKFEATGGGGSPSSRRGGAVSWAEVETPDASVSFTGTGSVAFGFSTSASGAVELPSFTGSGGTTFPFTLEGSGTAVPPAVTGTGSVTFGFSTAGTGDYQPAAVSGSGAISFGFALDASGSTGAPSFAGSGGVSYGFASGGDGASGVPTYTGSGAVAYGFTSGGTGSASVPEGTGAGGVQFGFALDAVGSSTFPEVSGTGSVAFGFSTAASGASVPPSLSGSGGVIFGFSADGTSNVPLILIASSSVTTRSVSCGVSTLTVATSSVEVEP